MEQLRHIKWGSYKEIYTIEENLRDFFNGFVPVNLDSW